MRPRLNLQSDILIISLLKAVFGESATQPAENAAVTQRRLELLKVEEIERLKALSPLQGDIAIREQRLKDKQGELRRAEADLEIHAGGPSTLPAGRRAAPDARKTELEQIRAFCQADVAAIAAEIKQLIELESKLSSELAQQRQQRGELIARLHSTAAFAVLDMLAQGRVNEARNWLSELRTLLRGDLLVAALFVLTELLGSADAAADDIATRANKATGMLHELQSLFAQHSDPLPRVLQALIDICRGKRPTLAELGALQEEQFSWGPFFELYRLCCSLSGYGVPESNNPGPLDSVLQQVNWHAALNYSADAALASETEPALAATAGPASPLSACLAAARWYGEQQHAAVLRSAGIDPLELRAVHSKPAGLAERLGLKQRTPLPDLLAMLAPDDGAVSSADCSGIWRACLACFVLLSLPEDFPDALREAWIEQSYGWPKHDLYWWTLASLRGDPALLGNLRRDSAQPFITPQSLT